MDEIVIEMYNKYNINHIDTYYRKILNKRLPSQNSPTNKNGVKSKTMNGESIMLFEKN